MIGLFLLIDYRLLFNELWELTKDGQVKSREHMIIFKLYINRQ